MLEPFVFIIIPIQCEEQVCFMLISLCLENVKQKKQKKLYVFLDTTSYVNIGQIFLHNTKTIKYFEPEEEFYFKTQGGYILKVDIFG